MNARLDLRSFAAALALALATTACASRPADAPEANATTQPPSDLGPEAPEESEVTPEPVERVALARGLHDSEMSEAVLDPRAESALTLDRDGGVRLWPTIRGTDVAAPLVLPVQEPAWMSLAKTADGSFLVAFVDTAGAGRVGRVEVGSQGARWQTLFETPATEPLFELHAIDGGRRVLGLRVDHRIELFDTEGTVVSSIDQAGFVPWQLRVSPRPGGAPAVLAVLAGPTRVQPISVQEDRLALEGEARTVVIDRGPNRNDLILSPDGTKVAALRKPRSRKPRVTIEIIDLATDERRLVVGETDDRRLPRMHWVDDAQLLLESGTGHGFWVDLGSAIPWTGETGRDETDPVDAVALREVALPYSKDGLRSHASVVEGLRVVPTPQGLVLDPLDDGTHVRLGSAMVRPRAVAMDEDGGRVAWSTGGSILLEDLDDADGPRSIADLDAVELAFVGTDRLVAMTRSGEVTVRSCEGGEVLHKGTLPISGDVAASGVVRVEGGGVRIAGDGDRRGQSFHALEVTAEGLGATLDLTSRDRMRWSELDLVRRELSGVLEELGVESLGPKEVRRLVEDDAGRHLLVSGGMAPVLLTVADGQTQEWLLRPGEVERLVPAPAGDRVAVVQLVRSSDVFVDFARQSQLDEYAVSVVDLSTGARLWTRATTGFTDLSWSGDGERLAVAGHDGGRVIEAKTGEQRLRRLHRGLEVQSADDPSLGS